MGMQTPLSDWHPTGADSEGQTDKDFGATRSTAHHIWFHFFYLRFVSHILLIPYCDVALNYSYTSTHHLPCWASQGYFQPCKYCDELFLVHLLHSQKITGFIKPSNSTVLAMLWTPLLASTGVLFQSPWDHTQNPYSVIHSHAKKVWRRSFCCMWQRQHLQWSSWWSLYLVTFVSLKQM